MSRSARAPERQSGIAVSLARNEDFEAIDQMIAEAYAHDYGPSGDQSEFSTRSRARAEGFDVWVASDESGVLGSVTARRIHGPSLHEGVPDGEIDVRLLGVSPTARRRGIGALLMRQVIAHAAEQGAAAVSLKTQPFMVGAHTLYEGLGFERAPERDGLWIGGEKVLDLLAYVIRPPACDVTD